MRTSRLSKDTSRLVSSASTPSSSSTARVTRSTRASLRQFALKQEPAEDIEDAIPDDTAQTNGVKRKRTTRTSRTSAHFKTEDVNGGRTGKVKKEEWEEDTESGSDASGLSSPPASDSEASISSAASLPPSKPKRQPKKRIKSSPTSSSSPIRPSENWEKIYTLVREMRAPGGLASNAAVDTMGCHALALPTSSPRDQRLQTLIALMLSSQTKDVTTAAAMRDLQSQLPVAPASATNPTPQPGINLSNLLAVEPSKLNEIIGKVGFHNNKTKYIKATAEILRDQFSGDIPDSVEGLMSLPGVGPKMAYLCMSAAWGKVLGIGVDVHVHRIANMWRWSGPRESKNPEETRKALESWLPKDRWAEVNHLLVGFGQTICTPEAGRRRCGECLVGLEGLCRVADRAKVNAGRKARAEGAKIEYEEVKVVKMDGEEGAKEEVVEEMRVVKEEGGEERVLAEVPGLKAHPGVMVEEEGAARGGGDREVPELVKKEEEEGRR